MYQVSILNDLSIHIELDSAHRVSYARGYTELALLRFRMVLCLSYASPGM